VLCLSRIEETPLIKRLTYLQLAPMAVSIAVVGVVAWAYINRLKD
jgi:hypothetical protein